MLKGVPFIKTNKKSSKNSPFVIGQSFEFWLKYTFKKLSNMDSNTALQWSLRELYL